MPRPAHADIGAAVGVFRLFYRPVGKRAVGDQRFVRRFRFGRRLRRCGGRGLRRRGGRFHEAPSQKIHPPVVEISKYKQNHRGQDNIRYGSRQSAEPFFRFHSSSSCGAYFSAKALFCPHRRKIIRAFFASRAPWTSASSKAANRSRKPSRTRPFRRANRRRCPQEPWQSRRRAYEQEDSRFHLLTENSIVRYSFGRCHFRISDKKALKRFYTASRQSAAQICCTVTARVWSMCVHSGVTKSDCTTIGTYVSMNTGNVNT